MLILAAFGLLLLLGLAVFQFLLVLGKPLGDFAWGGQYKVLPKKLRIASAFSIVLYAVFALFLASKAGIINVITNETVLTVGMWVLTGYFALGVVMDLISRSKKERLLMTPIALLLALIFAGVTFTSTTAQSPTSSSEIQA